jgi:hypothetical protein
MIDQAHGIVREPASKTGKGGMVGGSLIEGKPQKLLEGDPVIDLGFQFRIGVDVKPLLEQEAFQEDQGRIGLVAFMAFADGITSQKQILDTGPLHDGVDLFHSCDGPIVFHGIKKRNIRKGEVAFHFLEAHRSSRVMNLKEIWHKTGQMSSNINMLSTNNGVFNGNLSHKR